MDDELRLKALETLSQLDQEFEAIKSRWPEDTEIDGLKLACTCPACPEQYDVFTAAGTPVGYLRLRHGHFRADCPDCGGTTVYSADTDGDGIFDDAERVPQLTRAVAAIKEWMAQHDITV